MIQSVFVQFYCLPIWKIVTLLAVGTAVFLQLKERVHRFGFWKPLLIVGFLGFVAAILFLTVSGREEVVKGVVNLTPFHSYREVLAGGNPEIYRSNFMNVVLFYPAGLLATALLPEKWPGWCRCVPVVLLLGFLSAGIEYVQYTYALGRCEIDDVIHNTLGALAGSLAVLLMPSVLVWLSDKGKRMWEQYDHYRK